MISAPVDRSAGLAAACVRFLDELQAWADACIAELADAPALDGHDQGTFTVSWAPLLEARGHRPVLDFMKALRDKTKAHFDATGLWKHGYWRMADVHHGTEHFELFLGTLAPLDRSDGRTAAQVADAAEHMGNWVAEVPPWFDWGTALFRSTHLGADGAKGEAPAAMNLPPHLRCVNVCLLAHRLTGQDRYLALSRLHAGRWADAIASADGLPLALVAHQVPGGSEEETTGAYRRFVGQAPATRTQVDRAEALLASSGVETLLELGRLTGEERFRAAAAKIVDVLATQLDDPDAGPAAAAIRSWREGTGDHRYDPVVLEAAAKLEPFGFTELALEPVVERDGRPSGIGKRSDLPGWLEDGQPRRHNPILLGLAAELGRDERLATRAVDLGRAYFALARQAYPHGRRHGCSARTVSAVARGHGRNNNAGVVTAVLAPSLAAFGL